MDPRYAPGQEQARRRQRQSEEEKKEEKMPSRVGTTLPVATLDDIAREGVKTVEMVGYAKILLESRQKQRL